MNRRIHFSLDSQKSWREVMKRSFLAALVVLLVLVQAVLVFAFPWIIAGVVVYVGAVVGSEIYAAGSDCIPSPFCNPNYCQTWDDPVACQELKESMGSINCCTGTLVTTGSTAGAQ